ncbi:MAG: hypothetical protein IJB83_02690 [Bacilli bacterium]|nr:hypothetical protein [Bacilli bacterium]
MFKIDKTSKQISLTRGDVAQIEVSALNEDGTDYTFNEGDIIRFKVIKRKECNSVELQKDVEVNEAGTIVNISLTSEDTKIGGLINKPVKYWYEVEVNPETNCQTIIGYDEDGEKIFMLYPEGSEE